MLSYAWLEILIQICQSGSSTEVRHFFIIQKEKAEGVGYPAVQHEHSDSISMQLSLKPFKAHTPGASLLAKLTRKFELRMGFLFLSGGDTVFCSIFINKRLCITQFMNACLNTKLLTTGSKTN